MPNSGRRAVRAPMSRRRLCGSCRDNGQRSRPSARPRAADGRRFARFAIAARVIAARTAIPQIVGASLRHQLPIGGEILVIVAEHRIEIPERAGIARLEPVLSDAEGGLVVIFAGVQMGPLAGQCLGDVEALLLQRLAIDRRRPRRNRRSEYSLRARDPASRGNNGRALQLAGSAANRSWQRADSADAARTD